MIKNLYTKNVLLLLALFLFCIAPARGDDTTPSTRLWNLNQVDIRQVIQTVSEETGKNFIIDPSVTGKISLTSNQPIASEQTYPLFLSLLQVLGYTAVPSGPAIKIVPITNAKGDVAGPGNQYGDAFIVDVIPLHHVTANKLLPILRPLIPGTGNVVAYSPSNTLIIASTANDIQRLKRIIYDVDKSNTNDIEIIPLKEAVAAQVVKVLNTLERRSPRISETILLAADDHTNSILMNGNEDDRLRMRALISQLDSSNGGSNTGHTDVIYLHYQKSNELAPILNSMIEKQESDTNTSKTTTLTTIQAEPSTNSLIITAPPIMMRNLKSVIARLDGKPAQVLVEAIIVEMDDSTLKQIGVQWGQLSVEGHGNNSNFSDAGLPRGFNDGVAVIKNGSMREIIHLLSDNTSVDILSTPSVVVIDNQRAEIEVGKTVSIETGSYSTTNASSSTVTPFNTFTRDNIGLHLYVTPQVNDGDAVRLEIDQGNETLEDPFIVSTTPVTNKTSLKTSVLVNNADILVLGGLISHTLSEQHSKIPLAGDIPLVGRLFNYTSKHAEKRNLMIFLKPIVIHDKQESLAITDSKYNFMRNEEMDWNERHKTNDEERLLPLWEDQETLPQPFAPTSG